MDQKLTWKLRRVAAGYRQRDVARRVGLTVARYGGIERGEIEPTGHEQQGIERFLPPLPDFDSPSERVSEATTSP